MYGCPVGMGRVHSQHHGQDKRQDRQADEQQNHAHHLVGEQRDQAARPAQSPR